VLGSQNPHPFGCAQGRLCRKERDKDGHPRSLSGLVAGSLGEYLGLRFLGQGWMNMGWLWKTAFFQERAGVASGYRLYRRFLSLFFRVLAWFVRKVALITSAFRLTLAAVRFNSPSSIDTNLGNARSVTTSIM
jgi:hypothetical protein